MSRFQVSSARPGRPLEERRPPLAAARDRSRPSHAGSWSPPACGSSRGTRPAVPPLRRRRSRRFDDWREHLENDRLRGGVEHPLMESHLAKYRKLIPALALLFHLVEALDRDPAGAPGTSPTTPCGRPSPGGDLLEAHARRVYSSVGDTDVEISAGPAREAPGRGFARPVLVPARLQPRLVAAGRRRLGPPGRDDLEDHGWLRTVEVPDTNDAPAPTFTSTPACRGKAQAA
ncbi:MAG: hypothetical protein U0790_11700 [Isosphaeraceae bacterium]